MVGSDTLSAKVATGFVPGARIADRYELVRTLGTGGMGEVFEAKDLVVSATIALKVLRADRATRETIERLRRELALARKVTHKNVCRMHDLGEHEGRVFLTMELVDGETLSSRIARGRLGFAEALAIADQLIAGLGAAHAAGILHRDFKSANVVLASDRAVVTDFGLARSEIAGEHEELTGEGGLVGTAAYMAPEQVEGKRATKASDVYALGVVLFEMIAGRVPFRGETPLATATARLTSEPPNIGTLRPDTPAAWEATILRCLARRPEDRFASITDVAASLRRDPRKPRRSLAIALALPAIVVAGAIGYWVAPRRGSEQSRSAATFQPITFRRGHVATARFVPDSKDIVYAAAWDGDPLTTFVQSPNRPDARALFEAGLRMCSIAHDGALALIASAGLSRGSLGVSSMSGEAPRPVADDIFECDFVPRTDRLALVRGRGGLRVLEFAGQRYENVLWSPRVSRDGKRVVFAQNDNGLRSIVTIEETGRVTKLLEQWRDIDAVAWSPDGREVWFSGARLPNQLHTLHAVDLNGAHRELLRTPTSLALHDVAPDGRVLLARDDRTMEAVLVGAGTAQRSLSWFDRTRISGIADAGASLAFCEIGVAGGGAAYAWQLDRAPVRLHESCGAALSPDGSRVIAWQDGFKIPEQLLLVPTGAGAPQPLARGAIEAFEGVAFSPDGQQVLTVGIERGARRRLYLQTLAGEPRAITPPDTTFPFGTQPMSPDGTLVFAHDVEGTVRLFPVAGGPARDIPGLGPRDRVLRWSSDGALFVARGDASRMVVHRLDVATGEARPIQEVVPSDPTGVEAISTIAITPDGKLTAFSVARRRSQLFVVEGLR